MDNDKDSIKKKAYKISCQFKTYNQLIWRLAELELFLQSGSDPVSEQVKSIAESISEQRPGLSDLHWLIAEKLILIKNKWKKSLDP